MSSYAYMKVLESTPLRYDRGIRILSGGTIDAVYERVAELGAAPGRRVLDLGCGTGNLALACVARGAHVIGVDSNAGMLDVARRKGESLAGPGELELLQLDAMELEDRFAADSFDAAVSCLLFSELWPAERAYVLHALTTRVRRRGLVVIADEVAPDTRLGRVLWRLGRAPLAAVAWLLTQTTTRPLEGLTELLGEAGFEEVESERMQGSVMVARGIVPEERQC